MSAFSASEQAKEIKAKYKVEKKNSDNTAWLGTNLVSVSQWEGKK